MAKYVTVFDLSDPSLVITEKNCSNADTLVDGQLWERRIDPSDVTLPNKLLTDIAGYFAKSLAANEGAIGDDSPLHKKSAKFEQKALQLSNAINRDSLGLESSALYGSVKTGRG